MTPADLRAAIASVPRLSLAHLPTPLHEAKRLRAALGGANRCPRILIKRDDLTGLALGGNKARKLEFLVADATAKGADTLITTGSSQSNHARMTAAAACIAGLDCYLVLSAETASPAVEGNLLLDQLYGAKVHHVSDFAGTFEETDEQKVRGLVARLEGVGRRPYVIPLGGSNALGTLGYTLAVAELAEQLSEEALPIARLYYASGSRGTQAGLTLGARLLSAPYQLYGIAVSRGTPEKTARALRIAKEAAELIGLPTRLTEEDLFTDERFIGAGYGIPTAECLEAITMLARTEAILLDPCYTGKAMAGLLAHVRSGEVSPQDTVAFLHTGGIPALFTSQCMEQVRPFLQRQIEEDLTGPTGRA